MFGVQFLRGSGGHVIRTANNDDAMNTQISAAALIATESLNNVTSLNMLIIDDPTQFTNINNSRLGRLDSSIIVVGTNGNPSSMKIMLYFRAWNTSRTKINGNYTCSFYNMSTSNWDESGCSTPIKNTILDRYECSCSHLSVFALLWTPSPPDFCKNVSHSIYTNGSCLTKAEIQVRPVIAVSLLWTDRFSL